MSDVSTEEPADAAEWAVVEIMGHRQHAGQVREVSRFGAQLLEILEFGTGDAAPWRVHQYGGAAIFSITPCTESHARAAVDRSGAYARQRDSTPLLEVLDDDDDVEPWAGESADER